MAGVEMTCPSEQQSREGSAIFIQRGHAVGRQYTDDLNLLLVEYNLLDQLGRSLASSPKPYRSMNEMDESSWPVPFCFGIVT